MSETSIWLWVGFNAFIVAMLALDLGVFHRKAHAVTVKEAAIWSGVWIVLALLFNVWVWQARGGQAGLEFLTGYLIEKSLSIDNIFVIALIFTYFRVPDKYQHRVLFWGILGALAMRAIFIFAGAALIEKFHGILYVFGAFLIFTGLKMAFFGKERFDPESNPMLRLVRRWMPVTSEYHEEKFFIRENGRRFATPLFLVLVLVESTDLVFAVDSIPAIFAVTRDPFLVYTSNIFAILGLRSMYFLLAGVMGKFSYLKLGLAVVLVFVGVKMTLVDLWKIPTPISLGVIATVIAVSIVASLIKDRRDAAAVRALPGEGATPTRRN